MTDRTFHFTLGPVQGFVAQARRTRDFWAGSFLLSWLAGAAMKTVIAQNGTIEFPTPDQNYLGWLHGNQQGSRPRQGSIPNRFKAKVNDAFEPESVANAVKTAWHAVAEAVWQKDLKRHCDPGTRTIWERQINGFWEIAWAIGDDDNLLDRRKNWRTQLSPEEAGIKCSVMTGWQELSGLPAPDKKALDAFWQPVRKDCGHDFADDEALCAIAFVKRRFPHCFEQVRVKMPSGWILHGWKVNSQTPSILDLAAANWLAEVVQKESEPVLLALHDAAERLPFSPSDCGVNRLDCVKKAYQIRGMSHLNSSVLFSHVLDNKHECSDLAAVRAMKQAIKSLKIKESPAPFYAVLLMDGDSLGELLRTKGSAVSDALDTFTGKVPNIVRQHNGFLIYAGGDDVLALLPLENALQCAAKIRQCYIEAFLAEGLESTISAAVEYAHVKMPLTRILSDSHHLLDEIAKDKCGRDAIAVRVWKPGGQALEWAMPWEIALTGDGQLKIVQQADQFASDRAEFSSKFLYKIRERFAFLNPPRDKLGESKEVIIFSKENVLSLLAVDYLSSGVNEKRSPKLKLQDARCIIEPLLEQCRPVIRHPEKKGGQNEFETSKRLEVDGALLVRFLAHKGVER